MIGEMTSQTKTWWTGFAFLWGASHGGNWLCSSQQRVWSIHIYIYVNMYNIYIYICLSIYIYILIYGMRKQHAFPTAQKSTLSAKIPNLWALKSQVFLLFGLFSPVNRHLQNMQQCMWAISIFRDPGFENKLALWSHIQSHLLLLTLW